MIPRPSQATQASCSWWLPSGVTAQATSHAWHPRSAGKSTRVSRPFSGSSGEQRPSAGAEHTASLADVALHCALTPAAGDVAAPMVLAMAPLHHSVRVGVVATPTAHEVAAVTAVGSLVALPGGGDKGSVSAHHHQHLPLPAKQPAASPLWLAPPSKKLGSILGEIEVLLSSTSQCLH